MPTNQHKETQPDTKRLIEPNAAQSGPFPPKGPDLTYLPDFASHVLGLNLYEKQRQILHDIDIPNSRVAGRFCNGYGKTSMISAPAVLWHPVVYPNSVTITTSGVFRQVKEQMWPRIREMASRLKGVVDIDLNQTDFTIMHKVDGKDCPSRAVGFSTDDPGKFEGWHADSLMIVLDESKTIPDEIFQAVDRCSQGQPTRVVMLSSPGPSRGTFYDAFHKNQRLHKCHSATAYDAPHIPKEHIEQMIQKHGIDHPFIRSMVFAEFMDMGGDQLVFPPRIVEAVLASPPVKKGGDKRAFCDFAAGGDENVFCAFEGNHVIAYEAWVERNTMAAVAKFLMLFKRYGLTPDEVGADAGGLGIPMCDAMAEAGFPVHRVNNGAKAYDDEMYANRGTEMWFSAARLFERMEAQMPSPVDDKLIEQLTTRRSKVDHKGRLMLESKDEMRRRGLNSPDRADAFIGALVFSSVQNDAIVNFCRRSWLDVLSDQIVAGNDAGHWCGD